MKYWSFVPVFALVFFPFRQKLSDEHLRIPGIKVSSSNSMGGVCFPTADDQGNWLVWTINVPYPARCLLH